MSTITPARPAHLCGRPVSGGRHVCALVRSRDQEYAIRAPYVREGLEAGDVILQVVDERMRADHDARMEAAGVPVERAHATGQLTTLAADDVYLPRGFFDQDRMLKLVEEVCEEARAKGAPRVRTFGSMAWALQGAPGSEEILEYEVRVNELVRGRPDVFVCSYDVGRFPATTIIDMMRTHSAVIIDGVYHENPYFVPPHEMLAELASRGAGKRG